jgi:hypothetical protein
MRRTLKEYRAGSGLTLRRARHQPQSCHAFGFELCHSQLNSPQPRQPVQRADRFQWRTPIDHSYWLSFKFAAHTQ